MLTVGQMTSTAATDVRSDRPIPPPTTARIDEARAEQLRAANINPRTGLATDYLNHFNEAIMLLEMVPDMPECAEDFLTWTPLSYAEHFWASNFKARDLAIEAYESADPKIRADFDNLTGDHDLDPDRGGQRRCARPSRTRPAPRWPSRPPPGSSRWWRWPAASSTATAETDVELAMSN